MTTDQSSRMVSRTLVRRWRQIVSDDLLVLAQIAGHVRNLGAKLDVDATLLPPNGVTLLVEGFASRYGLLPDGHRQITALLLPGDFFSLGNIAIAANQQPVSTVTPCTIVSFPREAIEVLGDARPAALQALWWSSFVEHSIAQEWIVSLGQRGAFARCAHLLCELYWRLRAVGLAGDGTFELPMTQTDLADCLGLSPVHINRTLQELRARQMVATRGRTYTILNFDTLAQAAMFDPTYLKLPAERQSAKASFGLARRAAQTNAGRTRRPASYRMRPRAKAV